MPRLPLAPPPLPEEALSSWIARIAARCDMSADDLVRCLMPNRLNLGSVARWIDYAPDPQLEAALAEAAGQPRIDFAVHRIAGAAASPQAAWPREDPAWCPVCLAGDVAADGAARGEVHGRRSWADGKYLICTIHECLLATDCPRCLQRAGYEPVNGRLRLWCRGCEAIADTALMPALIPYWPFGVPHQQRRCRTVSLSADARPLLLAMQAELPSLAPREAGGPLTGGGRRRPRARLAWARQLGADQVLDVLGRLCFVMLGPLWEDADRPSLARADAGGWALPDRWTPGSLHPATAAPALLAAVAFLAAEGGTSLAGVTWDPRILVTGEKSCIDAETLPWHLSACDAALARQLFSPAMEPFTLLLAALSSGKGGLAAAREASRRRYGMGGVTRQRRLVSQARLVETGAMRDTRDRREQAYPPAARFALQRLIPCLPAPRQRQESPFGWRAAVAVFTSIGSDPGDSDAVHRGGWPGTLMESRYIKYWVLRHVDRGATHLATTLENAACRARAEDKGLVLPEWPAVPAGPGPNPPVRPPRRPATTRGQSPRAARPPPPAA